jgi:hypothetical protein
MSEDAEVRRAVFDEGQRLACPAGCAPARFAVMQACWAAGQDARPSFDALAASLQAPPHPPTRGRRSRPRCWRWGSRARRCPQALANHDSPARELAQARRPLYAL